LFSDLPGAKWLFFYFILLYLCTMTNSPSIREYAAATIQKEIAALQKMLQYIDEHVEKAVDIMHQASGRIVLTGIGKSAIIAQKITATMNSTGTPALFMHAADAIHGDLGMMQPGDVALILSKSGESPEIKALLPFIKNFGNKIIALCGNQDSFLATHADVFVNTTVDGEACPNNLAPTTSTTAQLVMGDALAVCLLHLKGFTAKDFAKFHPGGALGKQLYLTVGELSRKNKRPSIDVGAGLKEVILEISGNMLGATAVLEEGKLVGVITDGDLRRMLEHDRPTEGIQARDIAGRNPKSIEEQELAVHALELMRQNDITQLIVTRNGDYAGMVHLHDLIREGLL
jgi:arabinose-5-phosphate isomerase